MPKPHTPEWNKLVRKTMREEDMSRAQAIRHLVKKYENLPKKVEKPKKKSKRRSSSKRRGGGRKKKRR